MNINKNNLSLVVAVLFMSVPLAGHADEVATRVDIPYESFQLDNGLTVIVHTDHATPTVFVGMWYGVGSKDEPPGKTGFAHLFEHLMFQGTENREGEYFSPFIEAGATGMNGTTSEDRTNYYSTVPTGALDMALWMESDRMSYLLGAITEDALNEQRGVVQNEKRQSETRPYAKMQDLIRAGIYPPDHPYRHSVIGSMDDLNAATLDDVREWFKTYYGASNVVLVLAGDVSLETAKQKVSHYFGEAPVGLPLDHPKQWIPELGSNREELVYDNVGQTRIARVWPLPGLNDKDTTLMYLVNESLVGNKNSPLRKLLVDELQLATNVGGYAYGRVMSGEYRLIIDLKPGVTPEQVLPVVEEVFHAYFDEGPDEQILENSKLAVNVSLMGDLERNSAIGGVLAEGLLYSDNPLFINTELKWLNDASSEEVRSTAARWLDQSYYQLTVLPFPDYESAAREVDRSSIPEVSTDTKLEFPPVASTVLDNGMKLVVAERGNIPLIDIVFQVGSGTTAAPPEAHAMTDFVFMLADKGTRKYDANELAAERDKIAMAGRLGADLEESQFSYRILSAKLDESLALSDEILQHPVFPDDELQKLKVQIAGLLATLAKSPSSAASSLFQRAVYGAGSPMDGVWHPDDLNQIEREKLQEYHDREVAPDNITVYMIGDIDLATARVALNKAFGRWKERSKSARQAIGHAAPAAPRVILVDQPGAASSTIISGHAIPGFDPSTSTELWVLNRVFGGSFESRLNMNLREDKAWSYGYSSSIQANHSGDQLLSMQGQVQTDKTAAAMQEIRKEFVAFAGERPATELETERVKINGIRSLPGQFETNSGFLQSIIDSDNFGLPYDYAEQRGARIEAVTRDEVVARTRALFRPDELVWVVVGDLSLIEDNVRALGFGDVEVWDAFGNRLR
ncbi:MAG TPA: pitrilysin family protein [Woeseiaceae bacterium]|nr:pitrilysin family protein [Woeseiaceae bacterium]